METKVELTNVGPIEGTFEFKLNGPGLYELRGGSGTGKSTVISALGMLSGHKVDLTLHDGAFNGDVKGFGVIVPVGSRKRRKGELEASTLEAENFDLTDIIDPNGKTQATRDGVRIKALAALSGLELTADDFDVDATEVEDYRS